MFFGLCILIFSRAFHLRLQKDQETLVVQCLGAGTSTELGSLFIADSVKVEAKLVKPEKLQVGAKVWLAPLADVDCSGAEAMMVPNDTPDYPKYMFSDAETFVEFDYLGSAA